jgi:hypothetical protein
MAAKILIIELIATAALKLNPICSGRINPESSWEAGDQVSK